MCSDPWRWVLLAVPKHEALNKDTKDGVEYPRLTAEDRHSMGIISLVLSDLSGSVLSALLQQGSCMQLAIRPRQHQGHI